MAEDKELDYILSDYEKGFLEGAIDADGCLRVRRFKRDNREYYYPSVGVSGTNRDFVEKVCFICGCVENIIPLGRAGRVYGTGASPTLHKDAWLCRLSRQHMLNILPQLELIVKEKQRLLLLEMLEIQKEPHWYEDEWNLRRVKEIYEKVSRLNGKKPRWSWEE